MRATSALLTLALTCATLICVALPAAAGDTAKTRYLDLVNRSRDSVTAVAIAPAGSTEFRASMLAQPVQGGGDATTLAIREEGCQFDVRLQFRDGRSVIYKNVDACRLQSLRIDPLRKGEDGTRLAKD